MSIYGDYLDQRNETKSFHKVMYSTINRYISKYTNLTLCLDKKTELIIKLLT